MTDHRKFFGLAAISLAATVAFYDMLWTLGLPLLTGSVFADEAQLIGTLGLAGLGIGIGWSFLMKWRWTWTVPAWLMLAFPLALSLYLVATRTEELSPAAQVPTVLHWHETPIVWPAFDGAVGLRLSIVLAWPAGDDGTANPPLLWLGPGLDLARRATLEEAQSGGQSILVSSSSGNAYRLALLHPLRRDLAVPRHDTITRFRGDSRGRVTLLYELFPATVAAMDGPNRICLAGQEAGPLPLRLSEGSELRALWIVSRQHLVSIDLSDSLTAIARASSSLNGNPRAWSDVHARLSPEGLERAGYRPCPKDHTGQAYEGECFCP